MDQADQADQADQTDQAEDFKDILKYTHLFLVKLISERM